MKTISLRLGGDLLTAIDSTRGEVPRERWIRAVLEEAVGAVLQQPDFEPDPQERSPILDAAERPRTWTICPEHPLAGGTESKGRMWCAEPGCTTLLRRI